MKYAVFFKYEVRVDVEANSMEEAEEKALDIEPDFSRMYYTNDYDIEEVVDDHEEVE